MFKFKSKKTATIYTVTVCECFGRYGYDAGTTKSFNNKDDAIAYATCYDNKAVIFSASVTDNNGKILYSRREVRK